VRLLPDDTILERRYWQYAFCQYAVNKSSSAIGDDLIFRAATECRQRSVVGILVRGKRRCFGL